MLRAGAKCSGMFGFSRAPSILAHSATCAMKLALAHTTKPTAPGEAQLEPRAVRCHLRQLAEQQLPKSSGKLPCSAFAPPVLVMPQHASALPLPLPWSHCPGPHKHHTVPIAWLWIQPPHCSTGPLAPWHVLLVPSSHG